MNHKWVAVIAFVLGTLGGALALAGGSLGLKPEVVAALVFILTQVAAKLGYDAPNGKQAAIIAELSSKEGKQS